MFLRKLKKKKCVIKLKFFYFFFFSLFVFCLHYFSFALLTIIRTTKQQGTQISTASNINKTTFMSSCRNQDETRERRKRGRGGGGWKRRLELGRGFDFTMQSIFWNNLFAGKNLLKQGKKYLASLIRIWYFGVLAKQTFIDIALVVLKIFKVVKPTPSPWNLTQSKPFRGQRKQWSGSSNSFLWFTF